MSCMISRSKLKITNDTNAITGSELKRLRTALSLTQVQLAERLGVDPNTYARWERQSMRIGCPVVLKLAMSYLAATACINAQS